MLRLDSKNDSDAVRAMIQDMSCAGLLDLLAESGASSAIDAALRNEARNQYEAGILSGDTIAAFWADDDSSGANVAWRESAQ